MGAPLNNINQNWEKAILNKLSKTVSVKEQHFTEEEKAQARENLGIEEGGGGSTDSKAVRFTPQTLTDAQKEQARNNIGASALGNDILVINNDPTVVSGTIQQTNFATLFGITQQEVYLIFSGKKTKLCYENPNTGSAEGTITQIYFVLYTESDELVGSRSLVLENNTRRCYFISLAYDTSEYYDIDVYIEPATPTISTNISADRNSNTKVTTPKAVADYVDAQSRGIPVANAIPANGMMANVHYELGTLTGNVSITVDSTSEVAGMMNIYSLSFVAGSTAPTITFPSSITGWAGNCLDGTTHGPVITAGKAYEFTLEGNLAVINQFEA